MTNNKFLNILIYIGLILLCALIGICIFWSIYAWIKYGSYPIPAIPSWALWFMWGR